MPNVWIILEVRPFGLHSLMARSEAHSTEEVSACGLRYIRIYFISPYRQWTPVTRNPCAPVESPIISNLPCTFHLSLRPHLPLLFPTFPHNRPALLLTAPVSDSHFSRHCPLIALPTCYSLPPTITPSATSAYCNILRCTVRRLSLPAPSIFSSHHHPVLKSPLRSPSRGFFFPQKIQSQKCWTSTAQCTGNITPSGSPIYWADGSPSRRERKFWKVNWPELLCCSLTCIERIADSANEKTDRIALGADWHTVDSALCILPCCAYCSLRHWGLLSVTAYC